MRSIVGKWFVKLAGRIEQVPSIHQPTDFPSQKRALPYSYSNLRSSSDSLLTRGTPRVQGVPAFSFANLACGEPRVVTVSWWIIPIA